MKLSFITEARDWHTYFRGVFSSEEIRNILNGDPASKRHTTSQMYWTRDIETAIRYSRASPHKDPATYKDPNAYIIEAQLNIKDKSSHGDEDAITVGETPWYRTETGDIKYPTYGPKWDKWFDQYWPTFPISKREQFANEFAEHGTGAGLPSRHWNKYAPIEKDAIRRGETTGTWLNIVTTKPVRSKGSNKIIAAYILEPRGGDERGTSYKITKTFGNGTLDQTKTYRPAYEFND